MLRLLARGHTCEEIARILCPSAKTVEGHKSRIMEKLNFRRRSELVRFALKHGLVSPE